MCAIWPLVNLWTITASSNQNLLRAGKGFVFSRGLPPPSPLLNALHSHYPDKTNHVCRGKGAVCMRARGEGWSVCISVLVLWESERHAVLAEFPLHLNQYIKTAVRQRLHTHTVHFKSIANAAFQLITNRGVYTHTHPHTHRSNAVCLYSLLWKILCRWILPHQPHQTQTY